MTVDEYHLIGIGGIGMSGLAQILLQKGHRVSGSDLNSTPMTESLQKNGAKIFRGHNKANISPSATIVFSSDIPHDNEEMKEAQRLGCTMLHRSELLSSLACSYKTVAIAGTHGKTTTSALMVHVLQNSGIDPKFAIGGTLANSQQNASFSNGDVFVIEADESDKTHLNYEYDIACITNIDTDHLAFYGSWDALVDSFLSFSQKQKQDGALFICIDDDVIRDLKIQGTTYGFSEKASLKGVNLRQNGWGIVFDIEYHNTTYCDVEVPLLGKHNALNALCVFGMCMQLGISPDKIISGLKTFLGVKRRMDLLCNVMEVRIFDDYGHHPTEIATTLQGLRKAVGERKIIAVFQPHRFSRMKHILHEFTDCFDSADHLIVSEIYGGGEKEVEGLTSSTIYDHIAKHTKISHQFLEKSSLVEKLHSMLRPFDVVIFFGAGDSTKLSYALSKTLQEKKLSKIRLGVFYGGMSCENEVSILSYQAMKDHFNEELYEVFPCEITQDGFWKKEADHSIQNKRIPESLFSELSTLEVAFPLFHGPNTEDGMMTAFFDVLGLATIGSDHKTSSFCMDKILSKDIAKSHGIAILPCISFDDATWNEEKKNILSEIEQTLSFPLFVKPSHLGSSIGITKVTQRKELVDAIEYAFMYDSSLSVEQGIDGVREIEVSILGTDCIEITDPSEVLMDGEFYDYEWKYFNSNLKVAPIATLEKKAKDELIDAAKKLYRVFGCQGLCRIDFFIDPANRIWFNELNPMPGLTKSSMFPIAWESRKVSRSEIINRLVISAFRKKRKQEKYLSSLCEFVTAQKKLHEK